MRRVPDVRHADLDLYQYDPLTRDVEVAFEVSSDPRKASDLTRRIARKLGAYAVLLIHQPNDNEHKHPVVVSTWTPTGKKVLNKAEMTWSEFIAYMRHLHDLHLDYRNSIALGNVA